MHPYVLKKIYENKDYYNYLKENSEWIVILKLNPSKYKDFEKYIKKKYGLRMQDKANNAINNINMLSEVLSSLK